MDGATVFTKTKGRPKGRKDGPRREGAPKRGRPKKKLDNGGNVALDGNGVDGACLLRYLHKDLTFSLLPQRTTTMLEMSLAAYGTMKTLPTISCNKSWNWRIRHSKG